MGIRDHRRASLSAKSKTGNPAWGVQLRALLGGSKGKKVGIVTDSDPLAAVRAAETSSALRKAGFQVGAPLMLPATPLDAATTARSLVAGVVAPPPVILLLTTGANALALAQQLAALGYTGTVGVGDSLYTPAAPAVGAGITVLTPVAPIEAATAAIRRMTADVRAVDATAAITPAVAEGYFAADFFLAVLRRVGRTLTAKRFAAAVNGGGFAYQVAGTVGRSTWPAMHTQALPCGALVQGDGTQYFVAEPYRCDPPIRISPLSQSPSSRRNPTFIVTWYHPTSPPSPMAPRMSVTSNQSRLRSVFAAPPDAVSDRVVDARRGRSDDLRDLVGVLHDGAPFSDATERDRRIRRTGAATRRTRAGPPGSTPRSNRCAR